MNLFLVWRAVSENYRAFLDLAPMTLEARELLRTELRDLIWKLALGSLGFLALTSLVALRISHRAAGPVNKLKNIMRRVAQGQRGVRMKLREGDEFQDLAQAFNQMMDQVEKSG